MSNAGPLTEPFTAPASCKTDTGVYMVKTSYSVQASNYVVAPFIGGPYNTINCMPSGYNPARSSYYSPAPSCPSGFTTACSNTNVAGTVTETVNTCCPTGLVYSCLSVSDKRYRGAGIYPWQATLACLSDFPSATWTRTSVTFIDGTTTTVQPTVSGSGGGIGAHGITIRFQSSDLITSSTSSISSTSSLSLTAPSSTAPSSTAPSSTEPSTTSSSSSGVSTGAAAGIGVGAGAVLLLAALLLFWLVRRRRQRKKNGAAPIPSPTYEGEYKGPQPLSTPAIPNQDQYSSLPPHDQIAELDTSDHQVHEIDGPQRHEML